MIEFTDAAIREVWMKVFGAECPESLTTVRVYEACLAELGGERLRKELMWR